MLGKTPEKAETEKCSQAYYLVSYFITSSDLIEIPGPVVAKFSNLWSLYWAR